MGTPAARAWLMASSVCGITPSSAATTSTAISVTLAPRARISVKASWPGVSTKEIFSSVAFDLIGADVLRDAAAFAAGDVDADDFIQQRRFAVVDVAQERDHRRARLELIGFVGHRIDHVVELFFGGLGLFQFDFGAEFGGQQFDGVGIDRRHDVGHGAGIKCQQLAQDLAGGDAQRFGKAADGGGQLQAWLCFCGERRCWCRSA